MDFHPRIIQKMSCEPQYGRVRLGPSSQLLETGMVGGAPRGQFEVTAENVRDFFRDLWGRGYQKRLAEELVVSPTTVNNWLVSGNFPPLAPAAIRALVDRVRVPSGGFMVQRVLDQYQVVDMDREPPQVVASSIPDAKVARLLARAPVVRDAAALAQQTLEARRPELRAAGFDFDSLALALRAAIGADEEDQGRGTAPLEEAASAEDRTASPVYKLNEVVRSIASEAPKTARVPRFDPTSGGVNAKYLLILDAPDDDDVRFGEASLVGLRKFRRSLSRAMAAAGIEASEVALWFAVPWLKTVRTPNPDSKAGGRPSVAYHSFEPDDIPKGLMWLDSMMEEFEPGALRRVILIGKVAHQARDVVANYVSADQIFETDSDARERGEISDETLEALKGHRVPAS